MPNLSERIMNMQFSPIRKLAPLAEKAKKEGKKVYPLNIGQPDVATPFIFYDAVKSFTDPVLKYSASQGIEEVIDSFIKYYKKWNIDFNKDELMVTNGGSEAILFALMAIADYDDNVIVPEPFYTNYNGFCQVAGVNTVPFLTKAEEGFHLPPEEEITKCINNRTRGILLSNPGNPTGVVYTPDEINLICKIAVEHDLFIIADEVYREFVYDNLEYMSFMHVKDENMLNHIILIDSISKRYSACGARIGLVGSKNKNVINNILKLCQSRLCVPTIEQIAASKLIDTPEEYFTETKFEYQKRRDIVYNALSQMEGVVCRKPRGAFYIIAKLPVTDAEAFTKWLLTEFHVNNETLMMAPADGFYATSGAGIDEVRISYCIKSEDLSKAMNILKLGLAEYKKISG